MNQMANYELNRLEKKEKILSSALERQQVPTEKSNSRWFLLDFHSLNASRLTTASTTINTQKQNIRILL